MDRRSMMLDDLVYLYGEERAHTAQEQLWALLEAFRQAHPDLAKAKNQPTNGPARRHSDHIRRYGQSGGCASVRGIE
jgi:hypothetical protein